MKRSPIGWREQRSAAKRSTSGRAATSRMPAFPDDGVQILDRLIEAVVDDHEIELGPVADIAPGILKPALDHRLGIGAARLEALLERLPRRRQDENRARVRQALTHSSAPCQSISKA